MQTIMSSSWQHIAYADVLYYYYPYCAASVHWWGLAIKLKVKTTNCPFHKTGCHQACRTIYLRVMIGSLLCFEEVCIAPNCTKIFF